MESTYKQNLTIERIFELFLYDPETGEISRKIKCGKGQAGYVFTHDHVKVDGINIGLHNIAWALHHGSWPPEGYIVDHKDLLRVNNRLNNLRLATPTQNQQNKAGYGSYPKGVVWRPRAKPWAARIRINGIKTHLGSFNTMEEAAEAYRVACIKHHGEFACYR